eukprot:CAMPEP_0173062652 /NCGR_PEP_ID=MMETSP1102-20130122/3932_1 /TAXON_ID=49646 /ORGANISM="Geminigera sp., Strain Caron Lab Isolate" /LENGTH=521 /DNA_ID=CAMNT_0013929337 /DNA_START=69 /DNA_END=1637 /DNA_ORIENTATION=-
MMEKNSRPEPEAENNEKSGLVVSDSSFERTPSDFEHALASPVRMATASAHRARLATNGLLSAELPNAVPNSPTKPVHEKKRASVISSIFGRMTLDPEWGHRVRPTLVVANLKFTSPLSIDKARTIAKERLCFFPRFRSRVLLDPQHPTVLKDVCFQELAISSIDFDYHVQEVGIGAKWGGAEVKAFISGIYADNMRHDSPLWNLYVINDMSDGKSMFVAGGGGMKVSKRVNPLAGVSKWHRAMYLGQGIFMGILGPAGDVADKANSLKLKNHRQPSAQVNFADTEKICLAEMKQLKNKFKSQGISINDVFAALMTMTLRAYYQEIGDPISSGTIRLAFAINSRSVSKAESHGNQVITSQFTCDFDYKDPVELLYKIKHQTDKLKSAMYGDVIRLKITKFFLPFVPKTSALDMILDYNGVSTGIFSNVPGPQRPVKLMGQTVEDLSFYALAPIGLYFGIITYNGRVSAGIVTSSETLKDPSKLARHWGRCWKDLQKAVDIAESQGRLLSPPPPQCPGALALP